MVPVVQTTSTESQSPDFDLVVDGDGLGPQRDVVLQVASREYTPKMTARGNVEFQITRGQLGISM
jgi:hypothetical protein